MKTQTIKIVPIEDIRILKKITLIIGDLNPQYAGEILYLRKFRDDYKMKEVPEEERDFNYMVNYPDQRLFPEDMVDQLTLASIKKYYPASLVHNKLLLFNTDFEELKRLKSRPAEDGMFNLYPDQIIYDPTSTGIMARIEPISVYIHWAQIIIQKDFTVYYPLNRTDIFDAFEDLVFV